MGLFATAGSSVTAFRAGQRVVVDPVQACGTCYACRVGRFNVCANLHVLGVHLDGGFRDRLTVPAASCVAIPNSVPIEIAALAEPFSVKERLLRTRDS